MEQAIQLDTLEQAALPIPTRKTRKVNKELALIMAIKGITYEEIGKRFGATKQAISLLLKQERAFIEGYKAFKEDPDVNYEVKEFRLLTALDSDKIKKMAGRDIAMSAGLFRDKVRLIRGQATSISVTATLELTEQVYKDLVASKYPETVDLMIGDQQAQTPETIAAQGKAALPAASGDGSGDGQAAKQPAKRGTRTMAQGKGKPASKPPRPANPPARKGKC